MNSHGFPLWTLLSCIVFSTIRFNLDTILIWKDTISNDSVCTDFYKPLDQHDWLIKKENAYLSTLISTPLTKKNTLEEVSMLWGLVSHQERY